MMTSAINLRPIPKPRKNVTKIIDNDSLPCSSDISTTSNPPIVPPKPPGLKFVGVKFRKGINLNVFQKTEEKKMSKDESSKSDEERKTAASKIVDNLINEVVKLTDVCDDYEEKKKLTESVITDSENQIQNETDSKTLSELDTNVNKSQNENINENIVITESQIDLIIDSTDKKEDNNDVKIKLNVENQSMKASTASSIDYIDNDENIWVTRTRDSKDKDKNFDINDEPFSTLNSNESLSTITEDSHPTTSLTTINSEDNIDNIQTTDKELEIIIPKEEDKEDKKEDIIDTNSLEYLQGQEQKKDQTNMQMNYSRTSQLNDHSTNHRKTVAISPVTSKSKIQPSTRKKIIRIEDSVPTEYNSSPIVQILAKADQERPRPPRTLDDFNKSFAAMSSSTVFQQNKHENYNSMSKSLFTGLSPGSSSGSSGISSDYNRSMPKIHEIKIQHDKSPSSSSNLPRMGVNGRQHQSNNLSLREMIVRSHPIWYLPNLGRTVSNRYLQQMPSGCFIVRSSTRPSSMALSIKLSPEAKTETDHYLIEKHGSTVKLEGSPHVFRSLPLLIEHYFRKNSELQCKLTLPPAIMMCNDINDLQRIATLGQDFWTSELSKIQFNKRQIPQQLSGINNVQIRISQKTNPATNDKEIKSKRTLPTKSEMLLKKSLSENNHFQHSRDNSNTSANSSVSSKSSSKSQKQPFFKSLFSSSSNNLQQSSDQQNKAPNSKFYLNDSSETFQKGASTSSENGLQPSSSLRRSFAKIASFKSKPKTTKDDASFNNLSAEAIKARQAAFRREKTDLSGMSIQRIVSHRNDNHSPTRKMFQKPALMPKNKDSDAMKSCIEELRAKRMNQTTKIDDKKSSLQKSTFHNNNNNNHQSTVMNTSGISKNDRATIMKEFDGFIQNNGKPYEVILRNKKPLVSKRNTKFNERLSVPNFNDNLTDDDNDDNNDKNYRFGRIENTGELDTINEGLITPVVRRKIYQFNNNENINNNKLVTSDNDNYTKDEYVQSHLKSKNQAENRSKQVPQIPNKPSTSSSSGHLSKNQSQDKQQLASGRSLYSVISSGKAENNSNTNPFLQKNWSQINSELKSKQKVAKVRPTPHSVNPSSNMSSTVSTLSNEQSKRQSEYAQLSEISNSFDPDHSIGSFHSTSSNPNQIIDNDDDAVSVAGTVFNEPWDSNAWESLLDIAKYGDEKPNIRSIATNIYLNSSNTIEEEELSSSPIDDVVISCVESDSDVNSRESDDLEIIEETMNESDEMILNKNNYLTINNRIWTDVSQRIPSEPGSKTSTYDPRRMTSNTSTLLKDRLMKSPSKKLNDPGIRIQSYVEKISKDTNTVFGATLKRFIECTIEGEECDPYVVIRNVRQFLNGIKNYLVKHGEGDLHLIIEKESNNLLSNEFLNIDAILEAILHKILLIPIKNHLYHLMVKEHSKNGSLQLISENIIKIRSMKLDEFGFKTNTKLPDSKELELIKNYLRKMQNHYSPLKKLESLLKALNIIINITSTNTSTNTSTLSSTLPSTNNNNNYVNKKLPPVDELIKCIVYILSKTSFINCEIEAWYMWELLPQQLLTTGDASYYLTTLFSSIHIIKNPDSIKRLGKCLFIDNNYMNNNKFDSFISIAIPDEQAGAIEYHTFPAVPQMNSSKLCRVIAHQFAITNPEDYGLYILFDGFETCLLPTECPDNIRDQLLEAGKPHLFAYKRHDAKIAWPKNVISSSSNQSSSSSSPKSNPESPPAFQLRPQHPVQPSPIHKRKQFPISSKIV